MVSTHPFRCVSCGSEEWLIQFKNTYGKYITDIECAKCHKDIYKVRAGGIKED